MAVLVEHILKRTRDTWKQYDILTPMDVYALYFGCSVSISGNYAIVGAYGDNIDSTKGNAGAAYLFKFDGTTWNKLKKLTKSSPGFGERFGFSVSINGDYAIVGSHFSDPGFINAGAAYIFYKDEGGSDNWGLQEELTASDKDNNDYFGYSVDISGSTILSISCSIITAARQCYVGMIAF